MSTIDKDSLVATRDYRESDKNFIFSTWLLGLYYGDSWYSDIPKQIFMGNYHKVIEHVLNTPGIVIKVACLKDEPEVILGYSILNSDLTAMHWVFVKKAWRKIGIAKSLIPVSINTVSNLTHIGKVILKRHPALIFNPFALT